MKPANILINEDCSVKLCDFGLARSITGVETAALIITGKQKEEAVDDVKASGGDEEVKLIGAEPAKLHH